MRTDGEDGKAIHEAIRLKVQEYGINLPYHGFRPHHLGKMWRAHEISAQLTDEQRSEVRQMIKDGLSDGNTPQAIHARIAEKMNTYGFEIPEDMERMPYSPRWSAVSDS